MCAWVAPVTAVTGAVAEAADFNNHRDDLNETSVAKSTAAGDMTYASAANALTRLAIGGTRSVLAVNASTTAPAWGPVYPSIGQILGSTAANLHIEYGQSTTLSTGVKAVSFAVGFSAAPHITSNEMAAGSGSYVSKASAITTGGFNLAVFDGASYIATTVQWIAIGPD